MPKEWSLYVDSMGVVLKGNLLTKKCRLTAADGEQLGGQGDYLVKGQDGLRRVVAAAEFEARFTPVE